MLFIFGIGGAIKGAAHRINDVIEKVIPNEIEKYIPNELYSLPESFGDIKNRAAIAAAVLAAAYGGPALMSAFPETAASVGLGTGAASGTAALTAPEILSASFAPAAGAGAAGGAAASSGLFGLGDVASAALITGGLGAAQGIASAKATKSENEKTRKENRDRFEFEKAQAAFNQKLALDQFRLQQQKLALDASSSGSSSKANEIAAIAALMRANSEGAAQKQSAISALIQGAQRLV